MNITDYIAFKREELKDENINTHGVAFMNGALEVLDFLEQRIKKGIIDVSSEPTDQQVITATAGYHSPERINRHLGAFNSCYEILYLRGYLTEEEFCLMKQISAHLDFLLHLLRTYDFNCIVEEEKRKNDPS